MKEILICGLPGRRLSEAIEFVRQSCVHATGHCTVINVNAMTDEVLREIGASDGPMLLWADSPGQDTVRWVHSSNAPVLLVEVPFQEAAREFMVTREASLSDCARVLALARTGWWQLAQFPRSIIVDIAQGVGTRIAPVLASWQVASPQFSPDGAGYDEPELAMDPPPAWNAEAISQLHAFYGKVASTEACEMTVPLPLLFDGAPPHLPVAGTIDLTGPVRALSFGPFLYLPRGQWVLSFSFETSLNRSGNSLMFDIFVDSEAKCVTEFDLAYDGHLEFECEFAVEDPWSTFEFRSHLRRGAIEGRYTPLALRIRRL